MLTVWAGLSVGAIYALVAIVFNIIFVASGTFNFAQPQFLMVGTFVAYTVVVTWSLPIVFAVLLGLLVGAAAGALEELLAVRPLPRNGAHGELVTTVGWAVIMQGIALLIWGSDPHRVRGFGSEHVVDVLGGRLTVDDIAIVVSVVVLALCIRWWFGHSRAGIACLATSEDRQAATLRGINVRLLSLGSFAAAGALLCGMGAVVVPKTFAVYSLGSVLVLKAFVSLAVGGFGSFIGALIGGLFVGLAEALSIKYWGTQYAEVTIFALLVAVLILRPQGLFGPRPVRVI